jgi:peptidoglycan biosynthesis protein MviN/MurJ (putative lipid II flippase)
MLLVASFLLLARLIGMGKEMAIAWRYGVGATVDGYVFVFSLVQWPLSITGSALSAVLVPLAVRLYHRAPLNVSCFRRELLGVVVLSALGLGAGAWLLLPWLVQQPWIGLTREQMVPAREMAAALAWVLPTGILSQLWASWLMARNSQLNSLLEGMPALTILVAVLLAGTTGALVWGTLIGFALQPGLLWLLLRCRGDVERPAISFRSSHWPEFSGGLAVMFVGLLLMSVVSLADQFFAAHLGPGALSTLGYCSRIVAVLAGLGATAIARSILPTLSRVHAEGKNDVARTAFKWGACLFCAGALLTVAGLWLAPDIVKLLFQRGLFTPQDTERVAELLRYALPQLPFYFFSVVMAHALLSQGRHAMLALIGAVSLVVKLGLSLLLVPRLGLNGLVLATAGVYLGSGVLAMRMLKAGWRSPNLPQSVDRLPRAMTGE